jgi:hypothetical protein
MAELRSSAFASLQLAYEKEGPPLESDVIVLAKRMVSKDGNSGAGRWMVECLASERRWSEVRECLIELESIEETNTEWAGFAVSMRDGFAYEELVMQAPDIELARRLIQPDGADPAYACQVADNALHLSLPLSAPESGNGWFYAPFYDREPRVQGKRGVKRKTASSRCTESGHTSAIRLGVLDPLSDLAAYRGLLLSYVETARLMSGPGVPDLGIYVNYLLGGLGEWKPQDRLPGASEQMSRYVASALEDGTLGAFMACLIASANELRLSVADSNGEGVDVPVATTTVTDYKLMSRDVVPALVAAVVLLGWRWQLDVAQGIEPELVPRPLNERISQADHTMKISTCDESIELSDYGTVPVLVKRVPVGDQHERHDELLQALIVAPHENLPVILDYGYVGDGPGQLHCIKMAALGKVHMPLGPDEQELAMRSVLRGLQKVHELEFAHGDVRWPNIVWDGRVFRLIDLQNCVDATQRHGPRDPRLDDYRDAAELMIYFFWQWATAPPSRILARVFIELRERPLEYLDGAEFAALFNQLAATAGAL